MHFHSDDVFASSCDAPYGQDNQTSPLSRLSDHKESTIKQIQATFSRRLRLSLFGVTCSALLLGALSFAPVAGAPHTTATHAQSLVATAHAAKRVEGPASPAMIIPIPQAQTESRTSSQVASNVVTSTAPVSLSYSTASYNYYVGVARQAAAQAGINPDLFVRQIQQESGFNPYAASGVGAVGIAQFMPGTAAEMGINPYNPEQSLHGAAHWMANLTSQYGGSYALALAAYNAGPGSANYALRAGGSNWLAYVPAETQHYVRTIMGW